MENWMKWVVEIQALAQSGLTYTKDVYDVERYERLREISAEMIANVADLPIGKVKDLFCNEVGYQTPKIVTRAAIFKNNKILLTQENSGKWTLPGGWCDVLESIESNTLKEVKEETGLDVKAKRIISLQDRNKNNKPVYPFGICKVFVLCELIGGQFEKNIETIGINYFAFDEIPDNLAEEKTNKKQIEMCFNSYKDTNWQTKFD